MAFWIWRCFLIPGSCKLFFPLSCSVCWCVTKKVNPTCEHVRVCWAPWAPTHPHPCAEMALCSAPDLALRAAPTKNKNRHSDRDGSESCEGFTHGPLLNLSGDFLERVREKKSWFGDKNWSLRWRLCWSQLVTLSHTWSHLVTALGTDGTSQVKLSLYVCLHRSFGKNFTRIVLTTIRTTRTTWRTSQQPPPYPPPQRRTLVHTCMS